LAKPDPEQRQVMMLEVLAASAIFVIAALVLFMVFYYRPG
jgi:hypothetical protein